MSVVPPVMSTSTPRVTAPLPTDPETHRRCPCGATAEAIRSPLGRVVAEPDGWVTVTVNGTPVRSYTLCPATARAVNAILAS